MVCVSVWSLLEYWGKNPPVHIAVRDLVTVMGGVSYGKPEDERQTPQPSRFRESTLDEVQAFVSAVRGG